MDTPSPEGAMIDTEAKAKTAIVQAGVKGDSRFPLRAEEGLRVAFLFRVRSDVSGFAKASDRIWQVHFVTATSFGTAVTRIVWVNAENGNLRLLLPEKTAEKEAPNQAFEAIGDPRSPQPQR